MSLYYTPVTSLQRSTNIKSVRSNLDTPTNTVSDYGERVINDAIDRWRKRFCACSLHIAEGSI